MATVTNHAKGARGFHTKDGRTVFLEPGETAEIDLAPLGPVEKAWVRAREVEIAAPRAAVKPTSEPAGAGGANGNPGAGANASGQSGQTIGAPNPQNLKGSSQ